MKVTVKMPKVADSTDEVVVLDVMVAEGDEVAVGDSLLEVETDKASVEVPSPVAGSVLAVLVKSDDEITTGTPVVSVEAAR